MAEQIKKTKEASSIKEAATATMEETTGSITINAAPAPPVKLNLGCGFRKLPGYINVDNREIVKPDVCGDVFEVFKTFADSTVDEVRAFDFMEHIPTDRVVALMWEIHRVLKSDGIFHFAIPSTDGRGAFQDPTHVSFWNINTWLYYCDPDWHALYPELPFFKALELRDGTASAQLRIIHTEGKVVPVK